MISRDRVRHILPSESRYSNKADINAFHFVCPLKREVEAREVLTSVPGVLPFPETKIINYQDFLTKRLIIGTLVGGICFPNVVDDVLIALRTRGIAGVEEESAIRVLKRKELVEAYGTVTGFRKWLARQ